MLSAVADAQSARRTTTRLVGFVVTCLTFLLTVWVVDRNTHRLKDANDAVSHTYQVIGSLERLLSTVKDAESGQRGFTLSGDSTYLQPYLDATARMQHEFEMVQALTADNPAQRARVDVLRTMLDRKLAYMDSVVRIRRVDDAAAVALVRSGGGLRAMNAVRTAVANLEREESRLMAQRSARSDAVVRQSLVVTVLASMLSVLMVVLLYRTVRAQDQAQRAAADAIAAERERLQITLSSIGDGVISTDANGTVTYANIVAQSLTGWTNAEAIGQPLTVIFNIVNEATRQPVENPAMRALREGRIVGLANHTILLSRDGSQRPIDDSAAPIRAQDGTITGCVLVFRDISDRYAAERTDRELRAELSTTLESMTDAFFRMDGEWRLRSLNGEAERLFRMPNDQTVGRIFWDLFPMMKDSPLHQNLQQCLDSRSPRDFEHYSDRWDRWYAIRCYPARDGGLSLYLRDITEARNAAQSMKLVEAESRAVSAESETQRRLFNTALSNTPDLIYIFDLKGAYSYVNNAVERFFGKPASELVGRTAHELTTDHALADRLAAQLAEVIASSRPLRDSTRIPDGANAGEYEIILVPVFDAHGVVEAVAGSTRDITELKRSEGLLRDADRRKDEFLATLAHELRNPLAPIRNGLEIIRIAGANTTVVEQARTMMDRQMNQMVRLVDDLLDVSRVTSGKLELQRERFALQLMIDIAIETAQPLIDAAGLTLTVTPADAPVTLTGDITRLAQVVSNLLSNSARYTPRGGDVFLTITRERHSVLVSVRDTGIGIPPDMLQSIFDMFTQVDRRLEKVSGGLGLGLSLVKAIVDGHGGTVEAHSDGEGRGSEFVVRLPIADDGAATPAA